VNIEFYQPKKLIPLQLETLYLNLFKKTLKTLSLSNGYLVDVSMISSKAMKRYNNQFRQKDYATDVLSFPFNEDPTVKQTEPIHLGQILINYQKAYAQAKSYQHEPLREFSFLFVHGLLHLLGYHHDTPKEEALMVSLQDQILGKRVTL
jgi:probable rRNA maturation factor